MDGFSGSGTGETLSQLLLTSRGRLLPALSAAKCPLEPALDRFTFSTHVFIEMLP